MHNKIRPIIKRRVAVIRLHLTQFATPGVYGALGFALVYGGVSAKDLGELHDVEADSALSLLALGVEAGLLEILPPDPSEGKQSSDPYEVIYLNTNAGLRKILRRLGRRGSPAGICIDALHDLSEQLEDHARRCLGWGQGRDGLRKADARIISYILSEMQFAEPHHKGMLERHLQHVVKALRKLNAERRVSDLVRYTDPQELMDLSLSSDLPDEMAAELRTYLTDLSRVGWGHLRDMRGCMAAHLLS
jgi:hypothetical protein